MVISRILPSSCEPSSPCNRWASLFFLRLYRQKRSKRRRASPTKTPITIPAIAPPDRLDEDDPVSAPDELVGRPDRELELAVTTLVPVDLGAAGRESVVRPGGSGASLAARIRPQLDGMPEFNATW